MFAGATAMTYPVPGQGGEDTTEEEADPCEDKSRQLCVVCTIVPDNLFLYSIYMCVNKRHVVRRYP